MNKTKINHKQGVTNVKNNIIDFSAIDTEERDDDKNTWNSMQFLCETDGKEAGYKSPKVVSEETVRRIKNAKVMVRAFEALSADLV